MRGVYINIVEIINSVISRDPTIDHNRFATRNEKHVHGKKASSIKFKGPPLIVRYLFSLGRKYTSECAKHINTYR